MFYVSRSTVSQNSLLSVSSDSEAIPFCRERMLPLMVIASSQFL